MVADGSGGIAHAQLALGNGMIMLGSVRPPDEYDGPVKTPAEAGTNTQVPHICIAEIDEHYRRAMEAGAEIAYEIADQDYGGPFVHRQRPGGVPVEFRLLQSLGRGQR